MPDGCSRKFATEIEVALDAGAPAAIAEEIGDVFFAAARQVKADPEAAIRRADAKFESVSASSRRRWARDGTASGTGIGGGGSGRWRLNWVPTRARKYTTT